MAFEGELVRMENGRWARYRSLAVCNPGHPEAEGPTILVAVELDASHQAVLAEAERAPSSGVSAPVARVSADAGLGDESHSRVH